MRTRPSWVAILSIASSVACGGWDRQAQMRHIRIETTPPGALVTVEDEQGKRALGPGPIDAELEYVEEHYDFNPWSVLLPISTCGAAAVFGVMAATSDELGVPLGLSVSAATLCLIFLPATIASASADGDVVSQYYSHGAPTFSATLPGHTEGTAILPVAEPPPETPIAIELHPQGEVGALAGQSTVVKSGGLGSVVRGPRRVVAVFPISSKTQQADRRLEGLTDYLLTRLAETGGYRVVPQDELRRMLIDQKKKSYAECVDESCQIELGKAVAAELTLTTKLIELGDECVLSATLYDLKTEATEAGASVRTACAEGRLMDGIEQLVDKLRR